ncbi:MAG: hypothetical protein R3D80_13240 [Paracoccaceae bacterium]
MLDVEEQITLSEEQAGDFAAGGDGADAGELLRERRRGEGGGRENRGNKRVFLDPSEGLDSFHARDPRTVGNEKVTIA